EDPMRITNGSGARAAAKLAGMSVSFAAAFVHSVTRASGTFPFSPLPPRANAWVPVGRAVGRVIPPSRSEGLVKADLRSAEETKEKSSCFVPGIPCAANAFQAALRNAFNVL